MSTFVLSRPSEAPRWQLAWPSSPAIATCAACGAHDRIADTDAIGEAHFCEACLEHIAQHAISPWGDGLGGDD